MKKMSEHETYLFILDKLERELEIINETEAACLSLGYDLSKYPKLRSQKLKQSIKFMKEKHPELEALPTEMR